MTRELLGLRMPNFQSIVFLRRQTYMEIFKCTLVYLKVTARFYYHIPNKLLILRCGAYCREARGKGWRLF